MTDDNQLIGSAEPTWDTPRMTEAGLDIGWDLRHGKQALSEVHGDPVYEADGVAIFQTTNFADHHELAEQWDVESRMIFLAMEDSAEVYLGQTNWHNARPFVIINGDLVNV